MSSTNAREEGRVRSSAETKKRFRNFINGQFVDSPETFENRNPIDGSLIGLVSEAGEPDVDAAVTAARAALNGPWGKIPVNERVALLHRIADEIDRRSSEFLRAEVADTGKPVRDAAGRDIPRGAANFRVFADLIKNIPAETFPLDTPDGRSALNYSIRVPKGVVGVICPWNLPLLLMTWKVGPALACGNTVIVKPSEETPGTATLLGEVMQSVGIPKGVYNVVHGFGPSSAGEFLVRHPGVNAITFTGESRTGTEIMKSAANGVRPVSFELGGKNAAVVFADADFEDAVEGVAQAVFANCGQVCLCAERVYVEREIFEEFAQALKAKAEALKPGHPEDKSTTLGPLISHEHREKVLSYYQKARTEGAKVITGGGIPAMSCELAKGSWIEPTIWSGLPETSSIVREEIFGPCCHVRPFEREDEAVALANDSAYGLCATLWTTNLARAHRLASQIEVGICWVNSWFLRDLRTPFGGSKLSGIGREGGIHSLEFYTELRNICVKL